mmetsp:Transcript_20702/g.42083  ORF Transcript_20702/g.42083 Transcript_20702/m.42083 type:complete len:326 (-) Transcript_20702:532-1509(-)|eukprot:CAMPEP_0174720260 /NCGR_PEP_ID=MMETSP1094-20130205/33150_1 /TAXON_ID=156173 /ORGANISM="Chrysochromulina brevifilum, Strain UTEX LB 985" /LENGTH=325 /DNA_ID=CAMNT_0015920721 /DNA_START=46 /DNA_END=1023 /DNA_ORIENTATION=+
MSSSSTEKEDIEKCGWVLGKELGSGHFAKVKKVTRKSDGLEAACKIIKKPRDLKKRKMVEVEERILQSVDHPHVVKCYACYETDERMYLFLELMEGGELFDRIVDQGHYSEEEAAQTTYKLLSALKHMHDKGIAHRDLKPENMLMSSKKPDADVKITDFGLSKFFDEQTTVMKTPCGTPGYIAPEVLHMKGYDKQCDVWSLGVIIYILLCGFPPFYADNDAQLFERIKKGQYEFLRPYWDPVSDAAKDFIRMMLVVDPKKRKTVDELLAESWLSKAKAQVGDLAGTTKRLSTSSELPAHREKLLKLKATFLAAWAVTERGQAEGS